MASRRGPGEGSIYRRASDGKWVAAVTIPDSGGRRKPLYGKSRTEVRRKMKEFRATLDAGVVPEEGREQTIGQWAEYWLETVLPARVRAGKLSPTTSGDYAYNVRRYIVPMLGRTKLSKLTTRQVRAWLAEMERQPHGRYPDRVISTTTVNNVYVILCALLTAAVREQLIARNPAKLAQPPSKAAFEAQPLTPDEVRALLGAVLDSQWRALWLVMIGTGLRRGEVAGLQWEDIDLDEHVLQVRTALVRARRQTPDPVTGAKTELLRKAPKSRASAAPVALPTLVVEALQLHFREQSRRRVTQTVWVDDHAVFTTGMGKAIEPAFINQKWAALCRAAGVRKCRPHDMRHTAGTWMHGAQVDLKTIQVMLRHARLSTTANIYTHPADPIKVEAAVAMDSALRRAIES